MTEGVDEVAYLLVQEEVVEVVAQFKLHQEGGLDKSPLQVVAILQVVEDYHLVKGEADVAACPLVDEVAAQLKPRQDAELDLNPLQPQAEVSLLE